MKSYSEIEANAYKKAEQRIIDRKKHRSAFIRRTSAFTLGTAAVLGIGIFTHAMKPPKKPSQSQPGIITEAESNPSETTTLPSQNNTDTATTINTSTTVTSDATTTSSTLQTSTTLISTTTTKTHTTNDTSTSLSSTATTKATDDFHVETTASTVHLSTTTTTTRSPVLVETTLSSMPQVIVTVDTAQATTTTTAATITEETTTTTAATTTANLEIYERFKYIEYNKKMYTTKGWEARSMEVGEQIDSTAFISDDSLLSCNVQIYEYVSGSEAGSFPIVIKFEGYDGYWIYWRTW